ncbi:hypothetical protein BOX15_Mlig012288g2 [Macrostomum lignano]|uniref:Uncharacterized protein n=2 Tax=Macrostomum lignano TaxID=282301 RepID=A0A267FR81_9PLAT|nr:hypothetical protein BOX15_Mlig012288g2 [Macrostomum lignano]
MSSKSSKETSIDKSIETSQESRVQINHVSDSMTLLLYLGLLIVTILTVWLFKHRRFRFIHETGLAILYGLIVGVIIRYGSPSYQPSITMISIEDSPEQSNKLPPEKVLVNMSVLNESQIYEYDYKRRLYGNDINAPILDEKATFNPEVFFNFILPPIIFFAGFSMKRKHFFRNIGSILMLAFLGTTISCFVIGGVTFGISRASARLASIVSLSECLLFGAFISATDPVTILAIFSDLRVEPDLYALVFGESVLNDAVAIVLSESIETYGSAAAAGETAAISVLKAIGSFAGVFLGAIGIGCLLGCLTALITKFTQVREHPLLETSLFVLMSYSTFLAAEAVKSTGIVAVLFCGICQAHYTYNNLSDESKATTMSFFGLLNFLAENFTFVYIGVSVFTYSSHLWDPVFIVAGFLAMIIGRVLCVYPLCSLANIGRRRSGCAIGLTRMHVLAFSGLRGAMAFALAIRNTSSDARKIIFSTTLILVMITVLVCGGLTTQMLQWMHIEVGVDEEPNRQRLDRQDSTGEAASQPSLRDRSCIALGWRKIDKNFVKPLLTNARPLLTETCSGCCLPLARLLTTTEQLTQAAVQRDLYSGGQEDTDVIVPPDSDSFAGLGEGGQVNKAGPAAPASLQVATTGDADNNGAASPVLF